jgi:hypothetical protein
MKTIKTFIFILSIFLNSCWLKKATCEESIKIYSNLEINLIADRIFWNGNDFRVYGKSVNNSKIESSFSHIGDWYYSIGDKFKMGDTIIKKKGEPIIRVYRKGERWSYTYRCDNEIVSSENVRF